MKNKIKANNISTTGYLRKIFSCNKISVFKSSPITSLDNDDPLRALGWRLDGPYAISGGLETPCEKLTYIGTPLFKTGALACGIKYCILGRYLVILGQYNFPIVRTPEQYATLITRSFPKVGSSIEKSSFPCVGLGQWSRDPRNPPVN